MNSVKIKICGLTNAQDALDAVELGADYLGFNFYPDSPRYLPPEDAKKLFEEIPSNIPKVGVFVNKDLQKVIDLAVELELDYLQFHGDERPEELNSLGRPWWKAFRLRSEADVLEIPKFDCETILVDAYSDKAYGGTGMIAHWDLVHKAKGYGKKIFLAGGLTPDNIQMAVATVKPFGVDVASGLEIKPGVKDRQKMEEFIRKAKHT